MTPISDRRTGFALPAVLTVTGVVTLVFVVAITALASLTAEAAAARARIGFLQRALTLEANVAYLAVTEPTTPRAIELGGIRRIGALMDDAEPGSGSGLAPGDLLLDGQLYSTNFRGPMTLSLRDQAGMLNLPQLTPAQWRALGERLGVDRPASESLQPRFRDYVDTDSLELEGGGERAAYGGSGPANRPLLRTNELLSVLGVRNEVSPVRWRALRRELAADQGQTSFNVNTASATVLEVLFDLRPEQAERAVDVRRDAPFFDLTEFAAATGGVVLDAGEASYAFPSGKILFTLSDGRSPWVYSGRLSLTPSDAERPIWLDQTDLMESPRNTVADTTNALPLPYAIR